MGYHLRSGAGNLPKGVWQNREQRRRIINYCPEIAIILDMKLERERCPGDNGEGVLVDILLGEPVDLAPSEPVDIPPGEENRDKSQPTSSIE